jgi:hypothetical protein
LRQRLGKLDPEQWPERDHKGRPRDPLKESARVPVFWKKEHKPLILTGSSRGMCGAVRRLVDKCLGAEAGTVPVIVIQVDSYQMKKVGTVYYPIFDIVDWIPVPQVMRLLSGAHDDEPEKRPRITNPEQARKSAKKSKR